MSMHFFDEAEKVIVSPSSDAEGGLRIVVQSEDESGGTVSHEIRIVPRHGLRFATRNQVIGAHHEEVSPC